MSKNIDIQSTISEVQNFLEGHNDKKYLVNFEVDRDNNKAICYFDNKGEKWTEKIEYRPFVFIKDMKKAGYDFTSMYERQILFDKMRVYGINIVKLDTDKQPRLEDGFCYRVESSISLNAILKYFKSIGCDYYEYLRDDLGNILKDNRGFKQYKYRDLFYVPRLEEQFLISTGIRHYKGIEKYDDIHKLTFDIETTGLKYQKSRIFAIGIKDNRGYENVLQVRKEDDDKEERRIIIEFFKEIEKVNPSIIAGYNSEDFDFVFILGRAQILEIDIEGIKTTRSREHSIFKRFAKVKVGNTTQEYNRTYMWGYSVIDINHASKRTQALDSDMDNTRLKYVCKYEGIAKPNRMYMDGDKIFKIYREDKIYLISKDTNNYKLIPEEYQSVSKDLFKAQTLKDIGEISEEDYREYKKIILGGDKERLLWFMQNSKEYNNNVKLISGKQILYQYLIDDLWETEAVDNKYNQSSFLLAKYLPTDYHRVCTMGSAGMWDLLMTTYSYENKMAIPVKEKKGEFSGGLTRCYKIGYSKNVVKIDYASLYPMLQLCYDIFPVFDTKGIIKKMLLYMTTTRNIYKKLAVASPLNDAEINLLKSTNNHDIHEKVMANYEFDKGEQSFFKVLQLPIKILNNSLFGALGSGIAFHWADSMCASRITTSGRLQLRHAIAWFKQYGLEPLLAVTDGVNFSVPEITKFRITDEGITQGETEGLIDEMWQYKGEVGINAIIEYFNDTEMPDFMSVDNDGKFVSSYNISRINYANLKEEKDDKTGEVKRKIKFTGNTIKSKTMPEYIEDFVYTGMNYILDGDGYGFYKYYKTYVEQIFYGEIPLKKIATKKRIKETIKEYLNRGTDVNGRLKSKKAHMELLIQERNKLAIKIFKDNIDNFIEDKESKTIDDFSQEEINELVKDYMPPEPEYGSYIYYVNNGTRKSHADSGYKKDADGNEVMIASMIDANEIENNPDLKGEYNVDKYLDDLNSKVKSIIDCFDPEVRKKMIIKIKDVKEIDESGEKYTKKILDIKDIDPIELELKSYDNDDYNESMILEDKEVKFWNRSGYNPYHVWTGFVPTEKYDPSFYENVLEHVRKEHPDKVIKSVNDTYDTDEYVLLKDYGFFDIAKFNGQYLEILYRDVDYPNKEQHQIEHSYNNNVFKEFKNEFLKGKMTDEAIKEIELIHIYNEKNAWKTFLEFVEKQQYKEMMELGLDVDIM